MAVQVNPITQSLPATTAIQDPAVRRFAQAVNDAFSALQSGEGSVQMLQRAAAAMSGASGGSGGTPPGIAQWLFSSDIYQKLAAEIERIRNTTALDFEAVELENQALQDAINHIQATLATIQDTPAYDPATSYAVGEMVAYEDKLYKAIAPTTGNLPTDAAYWKKVGDYASLGDVVAAHTTQLSEQDSRITQNANGLTAESSARDALAAQLRGGYAGTDASQVTQGLIYSERFARTAADAALAQNISTVQASIADETLARQASISAIQQAMIDSESAAATDFSEIRAELEWQAQSDEIIGHAAAVLQQSGDMQQQLIAEAAITAEASARASADEAITHQVEIAISRLGAAEALIQSEQTTRASADEAITHQVETAISRLGSAEALIQSEQTTRASADEAITHQVETAISRLGSAEALIQSEQTTRSTNDLAIVNAVNTALAQITGVSTSISQSGENLIANWTQAQATKWSQIESEVLTSGGKTIRAALQQEATTRANVDGALGAQWTLKTDINGYISGFGFASTANNATPTSEFIIRADKFAIVMPGYGEHIPFAVGPGNISFNGLTNWSNVQGKTGFASISQITSTNVATYIANAAIGNAQIGGDIWSSNFVAGSAGWRIYRSGSAEFRNITARGDIEASSLKANTAMVNRANIVNAAVDTLQIAGNAVTIPVAASGTSSCQTPSVNFNSAALNIIVTGNSDLTGNPDYSPSGDVYLDLYRNGVRIGSWLVVSWDPTMRMRGGSVTAVFQDNPGAGAFYYTAKLVRYGGWLTASNQSVSVLVIGTRR